MGWKSQTGRKLEKSGLLEPRSKTAKLRAILPSIEVALANGSSYAECIAFLKTVDVDFTLAYFTVALNRARKAEAKGAKQNEIAKNVVGHAGENEELLRPNVSRRESKSGNVIITEWRNGTIISSIEKKDHLTNRIPNLEDFE